MVELQAKSRLPGINLKLGMPDLRGSGGTADTGGTAKSFLSEAKREEVLSLFDVEGEQKEALRTLLQGYSVILRLLSSKNKLIDAERLDNFCRETYLLQLRTFPWATVSSSVHRFLAHGGEVVKRNGGYGLGHLAEDTLEVCHKKLRKWRDSLARKTSMEDNMVDVFRRLYVQSEPSVRSRARKTVCKLCGEEGHSSRNCPERASQELGEDDVLVESFFMP